MTRREPRRTRLGVLGGTFDPLHIGHMILADEARANLNLDGVLFVPARHSPLKGQNTLFSADERCEMVSCAIANNPDFSLSRIDVDRQGPSFTADMLRLLREERGADTSLHFIMGMDSLQTFDHWRNPTEIVKLARLVVITRPGAELDLGALEARMPGVSQAIDLVPTLQIGISSTDIRRRLTQGLAYRYMVPEAVARYMADHPRAPSEG